ncbi:MAG: sensor domain-containing diguanylate cyclase [Acidobacteria bacterium]|nr:MAG: sensor domain-containing diguanylate cyclase [Acidobacteriota bacterium]
MRERDDRIRELEQQIARLALFHEVGKAVASALDLQKVLDTIMTKISEFLRPDTWALLMVDEKTKELHYRIAAGASAASLKDVRIRLGEGIGGWVAEHGEVVLIEDVTKEPRFSLKKHAWHAEAQSIVCVPVKGRGRVMGAIELVNTSRNQRFHEDDIPILVNLADYAGIALDNARYVQQIHELTITDDCTTLYNARHLNFVLDAEIYRSIRYGYEFSVVFIDLDHFKQVNDSHGHLAGSKLLWHVGALIKGHLRLIDYAFRYGGDEFVVLLPQTSKLNALSVVRRLREILNSVIFLEEEGLNVKVTASFGVAGFPSDARTRKELLSMADEAMYLVKNTTRNNIALVGEGVMN